MKKFVSLLLVLVLTMGMLTGICLAADKPDEAAQADAGIKVTDGKGDVYYFETLSNDVVAWAKQQLEGEKTITLLKDLSLDDSTGASESRYINLDGTLANWAGRNGHKNPVVFDLDGHTITYTGTANLFFAERFGFTLKNGTIIYNGLSDKGRGPITLGTTKGHTAITAGTTLWEPQVTVQNMKMYNLTAKGGSVINNYTYGMKLTIEDSTLWSVKWAGMTLGATTQEDLNSGGVPYSGDFMATVEIENSIIGSGNGYAFASGHEDYELSAMDTVFVSNGKVDTLYDEAAGLNFDTMGQDAVETEGWTLEQDGITMTGKAFAYGDAPGNKPLPFTDVKEADWYHAFVKELYNKGVINGMTETTFAPNGTLTYGQALKLIAVGIGEGEQAATGTHWASGYLKLAQDKQWISGDVNLDGPVTRLAFCQIAAAAKNLTEQPASNPFTDCSDPAVLALNKAGVINGMTDTTFGPDMTLTRAQISKIISLLSKL